MLPWLNAVVRASDEQAEGCFSKKGNRFSDVS